MKSFHKLEIDFLCIFLLLQQLLGSGVSATSVTTTKYEIECTMCTSCENPCQQVSSPPPPSPPPPSPPPSSSSSNCPPPPSPPSSSGGGGGGTYYYPPPPPSNPTYTYPPPSNGNGNGGIGGLYYPPPNKGNYPTPPPPNPIVPYFPFYYHPPPTKSFSFKPSSLLLHCSAGFAFALLLLF